MRLLEDTILPRQKFKILPRYSIGKESTSMGQFEEKTSIYG